MDAQTEPRNYDALLNGLDQYVEEEIEAVLELVTDEDTFCPARDLRAARLAAFQDMQRVLAALRDWAW